MNGKREVDGRGCLDDTRVGAVLLGRNHGTSFFFV